VSSPPLIAGPITNDESENITVKDGERDRRSPPGAEAPVHAQQKRDGGDQPNRGEEDRALGPGQEGGTGERPT